MGCTMLRLQHAATPCGVVCAHLWASAGRWAAVPAGQSTHSTCSWGKTGGPAERLCGSGTAARVSQDPGQISSDSGSPLADMAGCVAPQLLPASCLSMCIGAACCTSASIAPTPSVCHAPLPAPQPRQRAKSLPAGMRGRRGRVEKQGEQQTVGG